MPPEFPDYFRLMTDMMLVAFKADITRISTIMIGREGSTRAYPEIGVPDGHHPLTHHMGNMQMLDKVRQINELHMKLFAEFLVKLKNTKEGDSNLLDQFADRLRQRPLRRQRAHARSAADAARRPRRQLRQARPPHHLPARDAGGQSVRDHDRARRRAAGARRRFHRQAGRTVAELAPMAA